MLFFIYLLIGSLISSCLNSSLVYLSEYAPEIYSALKTELECNSFYVKSLEEALNNPQEDYKNGDIIITINIDHDISNEVEIYNKRNNTSKIKLYSIILEPPHVDWQPYNLLFYNKYDLLFTLDDTLSNHPFFKKYVKINFPQTSLTPIINSIPFSQRKLLTFINSYKTSCPRSPTSAYDLYKERIKLIQYFNDKDCFDFYGRLWQNSPYQDYVSFKGAIAHKTCILQKYKFLACFENSDITSGYITEKIFDAFTAGTVPIYWGAPNIESYIPPECFINMRKFPNYEELHKFLENITEETYNQYLAAINNFLQTPAAQSFLNTEVARFITQHIIKDLS